VSAYNQHFFEDQLAASARSANSIVPIVLSLAGPSSVVDVGCGIGCWSAAFLAHGLEVTGIDGDWVQPDMLQIPAANFTVHDLRQELRLERSFDLAVCIEVAEHLPPSRAVSLVRDLTRLAPCVLFSAAVPGQGGTDHINEQPLSYWVALFQEQGYQPLDCLRPEIWDDDRIGWWFRQNLVFFARPGHLILVKGANQARDLYHPVFVDSLRKRAEQPGLRASLRTIRRTIGRTVLRVFQPGRR
jgi:SAM-dependent methyltransferase